MKASDILLSLFDEKKIRILRHFLSNSEEDYYLREIAISTKVSDATTYRIINEFVDLNIINMRKIKKTKLYSLASNEQTKFLSNILKLDVRVLDKFVEQVKLIPQVETIVLHGKEQKNKANIFLIGDNIPPEGLKQICGEIKETYKFSISPLALTREQYEQMTSMGLYSGDKKILFTKSV